MTNQPHNHKVAPGAPICADINVIVRLLDNLDLPDDADKKIRSRLEKIREGAERIVKWGLKSGEIIEELTKQK
jgi:hypothetical protein